MEQYLVNKDSKVFLYGAGALGSKVGAYLLEIGFQIGGYIDQRAEEIAALHNIPCHSKEKMRNYIDKENDVIFVAVKDVFEHERIKDAMLDNGFQRIIYKPMSVLDGGGSECEKKISAVYDCVVEKRVAEAFQVPFAEKGSMTETVQFLREGEDWCVVYVPLELIYTGGYQAGIRDWSEVNSYALVPHISLFRFFSGDLSGEIEDYLSFCEASAMRSHVKITQAWRKNVLRNRQNVFMQMRKYMIMDSDFFIRGAPGVEWNEKGYFNLTSGNHRTAFFAFQGLPYMPCKISKADFERWRTATESIEKLPEAPCRVGVRDPEMEFWKGILQALFFHICKQGLRINGIPQYQGKSFLDLTQNNGYLTRNLSKFGLQICSPDEKPQYIIFDRRLKDLEKELPQIQEGYLFCIEEASSSGMAGTVIWRGLYAGEMVRLVMLGGENEHGANWQL